MNNEIVSNFEQFLDRLNNGDLQSIHENVASEFFSYVPGEDEPNATKVFFEIRSDLRVGFPDFNISLKDVQFDDGCIKGKLTLEGNHDGELWGTPPSGKKVSWMADIIVRLSDNKFVITWENLSIPELMGVFRQIGLVPPPEDMDKPPKYPTVLPEILLKALFTGQIADKHCSHLSDIRVVETSIKVCQKCVDEGEVWPALRMCLICGYVGCCDTSKNKHMKAHFEETGHPIFRSIREDESWVWCYLDNAFFSGRILSKFLEK